MFYSVYNQADRCTHLTGIYDLQSDKHMMRGPKGIFGLRRVEKEYLRNINGACDERYLLIRMMFKVPLNIALEIEDMKFETTMTRDSDYFEYNLSEFSTDVYLVKLNIRGIDIKECIVTI